jgi:hypothetical protein
MNPLQDHLAIMAVTQSVRKRTAPQRLWPTQMMRCGGRPPVSFSMTRLRFMAGLWELITARICFMKPERTQPDGCRRQPA